MNKDTVEEIVKEFWRTFNDLAFVRQMRSVAGNEQDGMVKDLDAVVEDREATVLIKGEFDKYGIDDFLRQALQQSFHAGLQRAGETLLKKVEEMPYGCIKCKKIDCPIPEHLEKHATLPRYAIIDLLAALTKEAEDK